jgi:hypothetical protein
MAPERLQSYVDDLLEHSHKSRREIEDELMQHGLDRDTASTMVTNAMDSQFLYEGGGGPALGQVGPRHMIVGTFASMYSMINFDVSVGYIFYGAIVAGAIDFLYGLMRFFDG